MMQGSMPALAESFLCTFTGASTGYVIPKQHAAPFATAAGE